MCPVTKNESIFEDTIRMAERMSAITKDVIVVSAEVSDLYRSENVNTFFTGSNICALTPADEKFITRFMDYTDSVWNDANFKAVDFIRPTGYSKIPAESQTGCTHRQIAQCLYPGIPFEQSPEIIQEGRPQYFGNRI